MFKTVFTTQNLASDERLARFDELQSNSDHPMRASTPDAASFTAHVESLDLAAVNVVGLTCSPTGIVRTGRQVRDFDPELYSIVLPRTGRILLEQGGQQAVLIPGHMALYTSSQPFRVEIDPIRDAPAAAATASLLRVQVPKALLQLPEQRLDRVLAQSLPGGSGVGALFTGVLGQLAADTHSYTPADLIRVGNLLTDLMTATLAHQFDLQTPSSLAEATLMPRIVAFIKHHLGDPELTPRAIAAAHHVSVSYLHRMFRAHDTTVGTWVRNQRLEHARRDLADPRMSRVAIHRIATRWGFGDHATFTRAFRGRFGTSPRDYRYATDVLSPGAIPEFREAVTLGSAAEAGGPAFEAATPGPSNTLLEEEQDARDNEPTGFTGAA